MGPELAVLVDGRLGTREIAFIENWVARVAETVEYGVRRWEFSVNTHNKKSPWFRNRKNVSQEYAWFHIDIIPFGGEAESHLGLDVDPVKFCNFLPYKPTAAISVWSGIKSKFSHYFIANTALAFARHFNSLIDMCGMIVPYTTGVEFQKRADPESIQYQQLVDDYMLKISGQFINVVYFNGIYTQIIDREFMESWILHKDFHIVT